MRFEKSLGIALSSVIEAKPSLTYYLRIQICPYVITVSFLVACTRFYKPLCRLVRPSVRPLVRPSVGRSVAVSSKSATYGLVCFLVACTRLYKTLCRSVGRSVRLSVCPSVRLSVGPLHLLSIADSAVSRLAETYYCPWPTARN